MFKLKKNDAERLAHEVILPAVKALVDKMIEDKVHAIKVSLGWKVQKYAWSDTLRRPDISVAEKLEAIEKYLGLEFTRTEAVPPRVEVKSIPKKEV